MKFWKDVKSKVSLGLGIAAIAGGVLLPGSPVGASAGGCTGDGGPPTRCVTVQGSGTWVDSVTATVTMTNGQSFYGRVRVWGDGFYYEGPTERLSDPDENGDSAEYSSSWDFDFGIGRVLQDGSWVCAAYSIVDGGGRATDRPPACVEIQA